MKGCIKNILTIYLCCTMIFHTLPVSASNTSDMARTIYMSSATAYAKVVNEDDVIANAHIICLAQVAEIDVNMYLQRAYGNVGRNVTSAYNMHVEDTNELDESAIIYNVTPGTYRVFIEVVVTGYDGLCDMVSVGTATFTINT